MSNSKAPTDIQQWIYDSVPQKHIGNASYWIEGANALYNHLQPKMEELEEQLKQMTESRDGALWVVKNFQDQLSAKDERIRELEVRTRVLESHLQLAKSTIESLAAKKNHYKEGLEEVREGGFGSLVDVRKLADEYLNPEGSDTTMLNQGNAADQPKAPINAPQIGMRGWVKASERLPERNKRLNLRLDGYPMSGEIDGECEYDCINVRIISYGHSIGIIPKKSSVEWLDETQSDISSIIEQVRKENPHKDGHYVSYARIGWNEALDAVEKRIK